MDSVVGLDISLTSTGIAACTGETNVFTTPDKFAGNIERYNFILESIMDVLNFINLAVGTPTVIIEGYAFAKRSSHAHAQGELGGIIRRELWIAGFGKVEVPPTNLKKFVTGKGNSNKVDMVSSVTLRTGVEWSGKGADDRVDAWGLRQAGLAHIGSPEYDWPKINMSALDKVDWAGF